jgi:hypothetical protein
MIGQYYHKLDQIEELVKHGIVSISAGGKITAPSDPNIIIGS